MSDSQITYRYINFFTEMPTWGHFEKRDKRFKQKLNENFPGYKIKSFTLYKENYATLKLEYDIKLMIPLHFEQIFKIFEDIHHTIFPSPSTNYIIFD